MSLQELEQLTAEWHPARFDYPAIPIHRYVEAHATERPHAPAVTFSGELLSYQELNQRANQLAHYLIRQGVGAEARVAVCLKPSLEVAISLLAILKAGGVYVPLDPNDPAERVAMILQDSRPTVILSQSYISGNLPAEANGRLCFDRENDNLHSLPLENPKTEIDFEQTAYLVYTSGTTGQPKGVLASHRNLIHYLLSAHDRYRFRETDVMPAVARFTFSISLFELLSPLVAGGKLVILERDQVLNFKRMVDVLRTVTVIHASPSWWRRLITYIVTSRRDDPGFFNLRHVSAGGDMVAGDLLEMMKSLFPNAEVFVIYGCTEVSCMACTYEASRDSAVSKTWLGKPFSRVELRLCDPDGVAVPAGDEGEIYVSGEGVTKGYLNRPQLTEEKFVLLDGKRFYRTGDLARCVDDNFEIIGRIDFQIQLRGIRIEPMEIETHLRRAPNVRDGVVAARELGASEKCLVAYIVLEESGQPKIEAIRHFLGTKLPDYMVPAAFVVLNAIPVNSNQKVDRRALPAPDYGNLAGLKSIVPPRDDCEKQLIDIWETTLGVFPIGIHNSFFELGGDSLQAIRILLQVEERWGLNLPITILLEASSVEALAKVLRNPVIRPEEPATQDVVLLHRGRGRFPLFCLQGLLLYQELAHCVESDQPIYAVFLQEEVELIKTGRYNSGDSVFSSIPRLASRYLQSIRTRQAHGPYYLAGSSFAGLVSFEIAHQLEAAGEEVALIALFDSMMMRKIALRRRLQCHWELFQQQGSSYLLKKAKLRLEKLGQRLGIVPKKIEEPARLQVSEAAGRSIAEEETILDEVSALAARSYLPKPYSGQIILFRASDQSFFNEDSPDLGWTPFARGKFEIHNIPGNHMGILKGLSASILAHRLQDYLAG